MREVPSPPKRKPTKTKLKKPTPVKVVKTVNAKPNTNTITTLEIEESLARFFDIRLNVIIPNISYGFHGLHECDIFVLKSNNYATEVEIKISLSDLKADFHKGHDHKSNYIREFYYAFPIKFYEAFEPLIPKHAGIITCEVSDEIVYSRIRRNATVNPLAKKLGIEDRLKIQRLGCMRIWSAKKREIKYKNEIKELKEKLESKN